MVTSLYAALSGFFLIFLSARVINQRRTARVSVGHADSPDLERAMRVQGNFVEYAPITLILLMLAEMQGLPTLAVHVFGLAFLASRVSHFAGFKSQEAPGRYRMFGMVGTFLIIGALGVVLIVQQFL